MTKTKLYKDPAREQQKPYKPYSPAYQVRGIVPTEISSGYVSPEHVSVEQKVPTAPHDRTRRSAPGIKTNVVVPYADILHDASPIGQGQIPNSGNNMETSWVSVDGDDFDSLIVEEYMSPHKADLDVNQPMIDNNIDDENNYQDIPTKIKAPPQNNSPEYTVDIPDEEKDAPTFAIGNDEYLLIIGGSILRIGSLETIQEEVRQLIFSEHHLSQMNNINLDDIIVLKRIKIKVGVFLD